MRIGLSELIVVLIVALLVLGPDKLPKYARKLGAALAEFRKASDEATREIRENVVEPLEEAQRPLREAMEPVEELDRTVKGNLKEVRASLERIGKQPPRKASAPESEPVSVSKETPSAEAVPVPEETPSADTVPPEVSL
ncbi:MAG: twin-arginine translocase TatA/TatE family subunit [Oscillibacter sp.]|nr:twin-arginine translocase TatA/TatE family subunit [Oscillibacter sp.]